MATSRFGWTEATGNLSRISASCSAFRQRRNNLPGFQAQPPASSCKVTDSCNFAVSDSHAHTPDRGNTAMSVARSERTLTTSTSNVCSPPSCEMADQKGECLIGRLRARSVGSLRSVHLLVPIDGWCRAAGVSHSAADSLPVAQKQKMFSRVHRSAAAPALELFVSACSQDHTERSLKQRSAWKSATGLPRMPQGLGFHLE